MRLHEAWDVQSCLFTLKLVVQRKEWWRSLALHSEARHAETEADRGRSSQCLCWVYTSTFLNRPRSSFPRRLYRDLSCHIEDCQNAIYYLNFLKKINKYCICSLHMVYTNGSVWIRVPLHPLSSICIYIRAGYRFRCHDSIRFDSRLFWLHSVNIVLIKKLLIFLKKMNSKHQFTNGELIKRN